MAFASLRGDHNLINYLIMDVDGTLTNGKIYVTATGELFKAFDVKDGCGIHEILPINEIEPVIITARKSKIVSRRCGELGITKIFQGVKDKVECLSKITTDYSTMAYMGDDILDLQCMKTIKDAGGLVACPADAVKEVKAVADFISKKNGGDGAVREFIDWLVTKQSTICKPLF